MKQLHCPSCGTPVVRVIYREGIVERLLNRFNIFPFRCQICTSRFRAVWSASPNATPVADRREYKRLPVSFHAEVLAENAAQTGNRVTEISMGGCTIETSAPLPRGSFLELIIKPASTDEAIKVESAMVCSVRPESMGIRFLELLANDKHRLSQVVLSLLVGQGLHPSLFS